MKTELQIELMADMKKKRELVEVKARLDPA